jgi:uncharacterized Zn finger protein
MTMSRPQLTEAVIRRLATPPSFDRGQQYLAQGAVLEAELRDGILMAAVEGSSYEPYRVIVKLDEGGIVEASCTCPYDLGGCCKHIVAVLLTYARQSGQVIERPSIASLLDGLDRDALAGLLADLLAAYPDLADWVEARVIGWASQQVQPEAGGGPRARETPLDPQPFRRQVRSILRGLGQMRASDAYWATGGVVDQVREVMMQAQPFVEAGDGRNALIILEAVAAEYVAEWFEFDDSDGELGGLFDEMGGMFAEALLSTDLSPDERDAWDAKLTAWQAEIEEYGVDEGFDVAIAAAELGWDHPPLQRVLRGEITEQGTWDGEAPWYADDLALPNVTTTPFAGWVKRARRTWLPAGQTNGAAT